MPTSHLMSRDRRDQSGISTNNHHCNGFYMILICWNASSDMSPPLDPGNSVILSESIRRLATAVFLNPAAFRANSLMASRFRRSAIKIPFRFSSIPLSVAVNPFIKACSSSPTSMVLSMGICASWIFCALMAVLTLPNMSPSNSGFVTFMRSGRQSWKAWSTVINISETALAVVNDGSIDVVVGVGIGAGVAVDGTTANAASAMRMSMSMRAMMFKSAFV
ncbi:hypothetical protein F4778DRAFT_735685, partial [Xylariomycetidae sp. FL2044]